MYHAHLDSNSEERIRSTFCSTDSVIRLLFSTIKMGMGIDIPDVGAVVIFGVPSTVVELW